MLSLRPANISRSSFVSIDEPYTITEEPSILEEESIPTVLADDEDEDDDDDDDSLADFAEGLGEDGDDELSETVAIAPASPRLPLRSNSSGFAETVSSSHESSTISVEDISFQSLPPTVAGAFSKANITRNPSNDSGVQFAGADNDSTSSAASHENATMTEEAPSNSVVDNRVSGFADEVLALLKF